MPRAGENPSLFRAEALQLYDSRNGGKLISAMPPTWSALNALLLAILTAAAAFASLSSYARTENLSGVVRSASRVSTLYAPQAGIVEALHVIEGGDVAKDSVIAELSIGPRLSDGSVYESKALAILEEKSEAIRKERHHIDINLALSEKRLNLELIQFDQGISSATEVYLVAQKRLLAAQQRKTELDLALAESLISADEYQIRTDQVLAIEQEVVKIRQEIFSLETQRKIAKSEFDVLRVRADEARAELDSRAVILDEERLLLNRSATLGIVAPAGGTISTVDVNVDQAVQAGDTVATVIPEDSPLIVEAYATAGSSGFLLVGQPVQLSFPDYPHAKFGLGRGRISGISEDARPLPPKLAAQSSYLFGYRVEIEIETTPFKDDHQKMPLKPDMRVDAVVVVDQRLLVEWFASPVIRQMRP